MAVLRVPVTLRLELIKHAKIKKIAGREARSMNNMLEYLVQNEIERYEKENGEIQITEEDIYLE